MKQSSGNAYHTAEGSVLDVAGFVGGFASDGVINLGHAGIGPGGAGQESYRGEQLGELVLSIAKYYPDVHRELHHLGVDVPDVADLPGGDADRIRADYC